MATLTLTAKDTAQERILAYLEENVSEILAEKINNGTPIEKDGKQLINKKTLDGFMKHATDEARKLAEKGASSAYIEDVIVFGWAIHYFEEESIEGTLYNQDGLEYKPEIKTAPRKYTPPVVASKPKQPNGQTSLFDLIETQLGNKDDDDMEDHDNDEIEETETADTEELKVEVKEDKSQKQVSKFYLQYMELQEKYPKDIVVSRLGDFYEAFGESAVTLSKELDLTLTGRNVGLDERLPMVGFPYHIADNYLNKIRSKHSVVVIEQEEIKRLEQTTKAKDGNTVIIDTGEIIDENNPYVEMLSILLNCKIKYVR
ncbi:MAG: hypothetical protein K2L70_00885 [Clostridia bacterium]|nr:hypothetical protein [Clostridia bacterium]